MNPRNPYLCLAIVIILGLGGLTGTVGAVLLSMQGREIPAALITVATGPFFALSSFLVVVPRGSMGGGNNQQPETSEVPWQTLASKLEAMDRHAKANEAHLQRLRDLLSQVQGQTAISPVAILAAKKEEK